MDNFPNQQEIHALIIMNDAIAQAVNIVPGDFRMRFCKGCIHPIGQFAHLAQIKNAGLRQLCIG